MLHDADASVIAGFDDARSDRAAKTPTRDVDLPSVDPLSLFLPEDQQSIDRSNAAAQGLQKSSSHPRETHVQHPGESGTVGVTRQTNEVPPPAAADAIREIENTFSARDIVRDLAKTIDTRFAEL